MVRVKHRYILVQILYPDAQAPVQGEHKSDEVRPSDEVGASDAARLVSSGLRLKGPEFRRAALSLYAPTPDVVTIPHLLKLLRTELSSLFGDYGAATAGSGLAIKYWSRATSTFILRCDRASLRLVWAACTSVKHLNLAPSSNADWKQTTRDSNRVEHTQESGKCIFNVLRVSGTIKKCEEEAIRKAAATCDIIRGSTSDSPNHGAALSIGASDTGSDSDG